MMPLRFLPSLVLLFLAIALASFMSLGSQASASPKSFAVASSVSDGATLSGSFQWTASPPGGSVDRIDFVVDGTVKWTEFHAPYQYNGSPHGVVDTTTLSNGSHTLALQARSSSGSVATASSRVTIANSSTTSAPVLSGTIAAPGGLAEVGQTIVASAGSWSGTAPITYAYAWQRCDSTGGACAPIGASGSSYTAAAADAGSTLRVRVSALNSAGSASALSDATAVIKQPTTTFTATSSIADGATLTGSLTWTALASNATISRIDFSVDGALKWTERAAPYQYNGDPGGVLDTTTLANGSHRLAVTAYSSDGRTATTTSTVTVSNGVSPAPVTSPGSWSSFVGVDAYRASDFAEIASVGMHVLRMDRPSASTIELARTYGIEVLPIAAYEPWADLNGAKGDKYPPLPQYYGEWARRMVDTWRNMSNPPRVIEVWNEPWLTSFWQPQPDPGAYLNLVKAFAAEAWKVWPNLTILVSADTVGSTNSTGTNLWRKYLLAADTSGFLNDPRILPTTHNYVEARTPTQVTSQPCYWDLDRFKCAYNDFKAHGHANPQVWVTEYGWESGVVGEQNQATYMSQALDIFRNSGMVASAYAFMFKTNDSWSYNWLRPDDSEKPVVSTVRAKLAG